MDHYAGIDVSLECSSVCVVESNGKIVRETKVPTEPEALIALFRSLGFGLFRAGHDTKPSRSEVLSPGRWIRSGRCPPGSFVSTQT